MLKKPLRQDETDRLVVWGAEGGLALCTSEEIAAQIVREINGHDDLYDALCECLSWMACYCEHPACDRCVATKDAKAAIAKAKPEPASRPDVTTEEVT